jgi:predicted AAA+ superfamily ATPase
VSIWKIGDLEIDFIAEKRDEIHYYQVALSVREKNVLERELRPLQNTWDFYPKTLLTADIDLDADYNWIEQQNVINWLLWKKWWEI